MANELETLERDIKSRKFRRVYLLFGKERFLLHKYERELRGGILSPGQEQMNFTLLEGRNVSASAISDAAETFPFFAEYRLVLCRETGLFEKGRKDESERLLAYLSNTPESAVLVFAEGEDVDKRTSLYKKIAKEGLAAELATPSEKELVRWVSDRFRENGKKITAQAAAFMLRQITNDLENINSECDKLIAYKSDGEEITEGDVALVCSKSTNARVFDLVDAIGGRRADVAIGVYADLLQMKEAPLMILSMIARQFRLIARCACLREGGASNAEIAEALGVRSFFIPEYLRQAANFSADAMLRVMESCHETDIRIKTGLLEDRLGVEMLILETV